VEDLLEKTKKEIRKKFPKFQFTTSTTSPWAPLDKDIRECKAVLITTGGLHLKTDAPFDTRYLEGDCSYRELPNGVTADKIMVTHESYDHRYINKDLNCVFPIDRFRELERDHVIGSLASTHYSFMGHIYVTEPLVNETAPEVAEKLLGEKVDLAFLTPT
jgi:D-proline reductase (dithiol) PrdB